MSPEQFRELALSLPDAIESAHMRHADFRVGGKIFATLGYPDELHGMIALPPEEQAVLVIDYPLVFLPAKGAWGKRGNTLVRLKNINLKLGRKTLMTAWRKRAPKQWEDKLDP